MGRAIKVGSKVVRGIKVGDRVSVGAKSSSCLKPDCEQCAMEKRITAKMLWARSVHTTQRLSKSESADSE